MYCCVPCGSAILCIPDVRNRSPSRIRPIKLTDAALRFIVRFLTIPTAHTPLGNCVFSVVEQQAEPSFSTGPPSGITAGKNNGNDPIDALDDMRRRRWPSHLLLIQSTFLSWRLGPESVSYC